MSSENSRTTISVEKSTHSNLNEVRMRMEGKAKKRLSWDAFFRELLK